MCSQFEIAWVFFNTDRLTSQIMTYAGFLLIFLIVPIWPLTALVVYDRSKGMSRNLSSGRWLLGYSFLLLVFIAVIYTTPWDNYLVATGVWWYDASKVWGITLGWVPLEEYLFFILQPILVGLWLLFLTPRFSIVNPRQEKDRAVQRGLTLMTFFSWMLSLILLNLRGSATYLGLEIAWALPAITLQLAFGGDILWRNRKLILLALIPTTLYLSLADAIAIQFGVWTINPTKSLGVLLAGVLPLEEFVFFLLTNVLVAFGFVLIWSPESHARLKHGWQKFKGGNRIKALSEEP
jgi:lycopene cyclase domain-containing protein